MCPPLEVKKLWNHLQEIPFTKRLFKNIKISLKYLVSILLIFLENIVQYSKPIEYWTKPTKINIFRTLALNIVNKLY